MKIIAHRGNKRYTPENTMASFISAAEYPVNGIEFDLQWTKDRVPVVIHDPSIDRTTNGRGAVRAFTLSELKQFDAGRMFHESFRGEKIPTFKEVLEWAQPYSLELHVELKQQPGYGEDFVNSCLDDIEAFSMNDRVVISTFYHPYLSMVKKRSASIQTALLTKVPIFRAKKYADKTKADAIHIRHSFQAARYYKKWHRKDIPVRVYRIHSAKEAGKCKKSHVEAVITDDPKLITEAF